MKQTLSQRVWRVVQWCFPVILCLALWEAISRGELVNPRLFPPPSASFTAWLTMLQQGVLRGDLQVSLWRMLVGFAIGGAVATLLGLLTGRVTWVDQLCSPIFQLLRPLPPVALIPLVIVWFGIGDVAKVFSIAFAVFFPVWINTHIGARAIPKEYLWGAKMLTQKRSTVFFRVIFPASLPAIISGMRVGISLAFIMVYVSEIAGASAGLGYRISVAQLGYRIDIMVAALCTLAACGALADYGFTKLMNRLFPWVEFGKGKLK